MEVNVRESRHERAVKLSGLTLRSFVTGLVSATVTCITRPWVN